jgi:hypothetical protein
MRVTGRVAILHIGPGPNFPETSRFLRSQGLSYPWEYSAGIHDDMVSFKCTSGDEVRKNDRVRVGNRAAQVEQVIKRELLSPVILAAKKRAAY